MHVIFLEPGFPSNQRQFVRALKAVGARVTGIGDRPVEQLDLEVKSLLDGYEYVKSTADIVMVTQAVRRIQQRGPWVHRLESTVEALMYCAAEVRAATGIPGMTVEQTVLCRDKFKMKQFLRARGIPCARSLIIRRANELTSFIQEVGFPVILKPLDGAGASLTYRIDTEACVLEVMRETQIETNPTQFVVEEFISGHEGFYDTLTIGGRVVFESISHYYPNVLEAMRTRWISPQIVVTNRVDAQGYQELRQLGRRVIRELGIDIAPTHMEWFFGSKGLSFSEIGARPPGCRVWDLYCAANDIDLYIEWARGLVHGQTAIRPSRRYSAGLVSIRPSQDGHISGYRGVEDVQRKYGQFILDMHLPAVGSPTSEVGAGYLAHAWVRVRHPDYDACRTILDEIGENLKLFAE